MKTDEKYKKWDLIRQEDARRLQQAILYLNQSETLIKDVLNRFSEDQGKTIISYEELSKIAYDVWLHPSPGVRFKRVRHKDKPLYFITEMNPKENQDNLSVFGLHQHDCKEICEVQEGHLIEMLERNKVYSKGDKVFYPAYYRHKPSAKILSVYGVEFIPKAPIEKCSTAKNNTRK